MIGIENKLIKRAKMLSEKREQYVGLKFNKLTIIDFVRYEENGKLICKAVCECGIINDYLFSSLKGGNTKSCGCIKKTDIGKLISDNNLLYSGVTFGNLTILEIIGYGHGWDIHCIAKCSCGITRTFSLYRIKAGITSSCGCQKSVLLSKNSKTHGLTKHPLYTIWSGIKQRCNNVKRPNHKWYGKKNISMCKQWTDDFVLFYDWAISNGWQKGLEVDRFPNKYGNYEPSNCRITTGAINSNNKTNHRMLMVNNEKLNLKQISNRFNIPYSTLQNRIRRGWDDHKVWSTPIQDQTPGKRRLPSK